VFHLMSAQKHRFSIQLHNQRLDRTREIIRIILNDGEGFFKSNWLVFEKRFVLFVLFVLFGIIPSCHLGRLLWKQCTAIWLGFLKKYPDHHSSSLILRSPKPAYHFTNYFIYSFQNPHLEFHPLIHRQNDLNAKAHQ
jgi:hypothetical protein